MLLSSCAEVEPLSSDQASTDGGGSVYLPDGSVLKFKNDFVTNNKMDPAVKVRLNLEHKAFSEYRFKKIGMNQSCDGAGTGSFGPAVTDDFYDLVTDVEGSFIVCAVGLFETTGLWLPESRAVFSKVIVVDSTAPTNVAVSFPSAYVNNIFSTVNFKATDATKFGFSFSSCNDISTFMAYTSRLPVTLVANTTNTVFVKYRDDLDNESSCVSASIVHDGVPPSAPIINAPVAGATYSHLETEIGFDVTCEPNATLTVTGVYSDSVTCDSSGKYLKSIPTSLLVEGDNVISFKQTDKAGNESPVTTGSIKFHNYVKGISLPKVDFEIDGAAQQILIPVTSSATYTSDKIIKYVIESEDTTNGATYFKYYDKDGVEKTPASYRVSGEVVLPANSNSTDIKINWLGVAQSKVIAKMRVYLTGDQRREGRYVTDIYIKNPSTTPKIAKLAVGATVTCSMLAASSKIPCMGRADTYQISGTTGLNLNSADSFAVTNPKDLSVGGILSCIVDTNSKVVCRGNFYYASSSVYTNNDNLTISSNANMTSVSVGYAHVCGLAADGVHCWGKAADGQLGGTATPPSYPTVGVMPNLGTGVTPLKVTTGNYHTCVLYAQTSDPSIKNIKCFGNNIHGQLGIGSLTATGTTAAQMTSLPAVKFKSGRTPIDLYSGGYHNCAILDDYSVSCWGKNSYGQLALGKSDDTGGKAYTALDTIDFKTTAKVTKLALGENHSCALFEDSTLKCWGDSTFFQLGYPFMMHVGLTQTSLDNWQSLSVQNPTDIVDIKAGGNISCAVYGSGDARCWGENFSGQRGVPYLQNYNYATPVFGSTFYKQVSTAYNHTCAITTDGKLDCWGLAGGGLLGDGSMDTKYFPVGNAESRNFKKVVTGTTLSCAQTVENELYCWGVNDKTQLGSGYTDPYITAPIKVNTNLVFTNFVVGAQHACGLTASGDVYCWGANDYGQLGLGDFVNRSIPTKVSSISNVTQIFSGLLTTCATTDGGVNLKCWGSNGGSIVDGAQTVDAKIATPKTRIGPLTGSYAPFFSTVSLYTKNLCYTVAYYSSAAKTAISTSSSYCLGDNSFAQIAYDETKLYNAPVSESSFWVWKYSAGATFLCGVVTSTANFSDMAAAGGTARCKGDNSGGYVGGELTDFYTSALTAVVFYDNALTKVAKSIKVEDISAAGVHACAIERYLESPSGLYKSGRLFCWGNNKLGQMGNIEMSGFYRDKTLILKHLISR